MYVRQQENTRISHMSRVLLWAHKYVANKPNNCSKNSIITHFKRGGCVQIGRGFGQQTSLYSYWSLYKPRTEISWDIKSYHFHSQPFADICPCLKYLIILFISWDIFGILSDFAQEDIVLALRPLLLYVKHHQRFQFERVTETGNVLLCIYRHRETVRDWGDLFDIVSSSTVGHVIIKTSIEQYLQFNLQK